MSKKIEEEGIPGFEWPEFNSEKARIKAYSKMYKNMSIVEAFAARYDFDSSKISERANQEPKELRVGDIIDTRILSISKGEVVYDLGNLKTNIQTAVNLYKYKKFHHFLPMDWIKAVVTRVDKNKVVVDPIAPMVDKWLTPMLKDPNIQKIIPSSETGATYEPVIVKDLQLTRGGFMGKAVIPNVSEFVGEDYTIDAFIPGSQIVLNITDNFEQFIGKSVETFVVNYMNKPGTNEKSLVCSAKEVIKFAGELNMIYMFNSWCEESDLWKQVVETTYSGKVTGIINSTKKCGVFVEIPELSVTGMVAVKPDELVNYKPHMDVPVKIVGFDEEKYFNYDAQQMQHVVPYEIEDGILRKCNLKPILQFV